MDGITFQKLRDIEARFVQVEAQLLVIDVQGLDSVDDAEDAAVEYAQAQVNCVLDGDCDDPGVIEFE